MAVIDKTCVAEGCAGHPCFGWGLPSWRQGMRWACWAHKAMLENVPAAQLRATVVGREAQGRLL